MTRATETGPRMNQRDNLSPKHLDLETRVAELVKKVYSEPKLLFHNGGTQMFMQDGVLAEERKENLEQLITNYLKGCDAYREFTRIMDEAVKPYRRQKMENGKLVTYIDYDEWERQDEESCWKYGLCEFNGFNHLDQLEWEIDLKIAHLYARKGVEILAEHDNGHR